jgi:tetratricopeptide (TPR) repeat protein
VEFLEAAQVIYKRLLEANPSVTRFQEESAYYSINAASALRRMGRPTEARAALERVRGLYERLVEVNPAVPTFRFFLARTHKDLADLDRTAGRPDEARAGYDRAIVIQEKLAKANPENPYSASGLAISLRRIGLLEYAAGRFAEAAAANHRAIELCDERVQNLERGWFVFELACCRAMQAGLAGKDGSGIPAAAGPAEADKAMDLLRKAVSAGYQNLDDLRTDTGLDPLRQRDDFKQLLAELEAKAKAPAKPPAQP